MFQRYAREQTHTNTEIHKQTRSSEYDTLLPRAEQGITPGEARRYALADGSSTVAKIAADLRPSADGSAVRTSLVAGGGYAAGSQRAYSLGSCAMGHTDGRIALFQNAPPPGKGKVFPYSLPSVGPGADPGVQAVSPQVT